MPKRCKITVEIDGNLSTYEYDEVEISQDRGIEVIYDANDPDPKDIQPNGQERIAIYAWTGITDFDHFEAQTEKTI